MKKKFAFIVHDPMMLVHYRDLWQELGSEKFVIITTSFFEKSPEGLERLGFKEFVKYVEKMGFESIPIERVINRGFKYEYSITNHIISGNTDYVENTQSNLVIKIKSGVGKFLSFLGISWPFVFRLNQFIKTFAKKILSALGLSRQFAYRLNHNLYLPLQVANKHIRFMYGADISEGWSLQPWNSIYDIFLCHGVNDKKAIESRFQGKVFVMGYPRYDRYFEEKIELGNIKNELKVVEGKKTLLWMPTLGGKASTIPHFSEPLSKLANKYNLIVRPHPLSFVQEVEYIQLLEKYNFCIDRNALRDMNELYSIADVVLADYGGTPFSAIFLGKNVVLLDSPDPDSDPINAGSSVMELRQYLPVFQYTQVKELEIAMDSKNFIDENNKVVDKLFKKYFDSPRGGGARRVAKLFETL